MSTLDVPEGRAFSKVSTFDNHTCGLRENGEAMCWGNNEQGRAAPPAGQFVDVSAGYDHTCGVRPTGEVECWGDNSDGETDVPDGLFAVPSTFSHGRETRDDMSFDTASVLARFAR